MFFLITAEVVTPVMSSPSAFGFQFTWIMEVRAGDIFLWLCLFTCCQNNSSLQSIPGKSQLDNFLVVR